MLFPTASILSVTYLIVKNVSGARICHLIGLHLVFSDAHFQEQYLHICCLMIKVDRTR